MAASATSVVVRLSPRRSRASVSGTSTFQRSLVWRFRNGLLRSKEFVSYLCFGVFSAQSRSDKILKTINMSRVRKKVFGVSYAERSIQPDS